MFFERIISNYHLSISIMVNHWKIIGLVELSLYTVLGLISIYPAYNLTARKSRFWYFFIRFFLLILVRICGSVLLTIFTYGAGNANVLIAAVVFSSVSLGFINMSLIFMLKFIEVFHNPDFKSNSKGYLDFVMPVAFMKRLFNSDYRRPFIWLEIAQKLVLLSILLSAIAGGLTDKAMRAMQKASSILYLCSIVMISFCLYQTHTDVQDYTVAARKLKNRLLILVAISIPLVFIRTISSVLNAFASRDQWGFNDYTIVTGKWQYYYFLHFLQEFLAAIMFTIAPWVVIRAEDHRDITTAATQKDEFEESVN